MQSKQAQDVVEALLKNDSTNEMAEMSGKLDQLVRLTDEALYLQKVALLEEGHILRFHAAGMHDIALSLPDAQDDYIQRYILKRRNFYEIKMLQAVQGMGLIKPGMTVGDIGANIGNHSVFFGKVLGARRVLAFEPQPHCYATLCRNLELNGQTEALAYNCMVGAKSGRGAVAHFNARNLGATSFAPAKDGPIPMVALDDLIDAEEMQGLSFIKIDVEGMQMDVLNGAKKVLKAFKPALWIEILKKDNSYAETAKLLEGLGYTATRLAPNNHIFIPRK